MKFCDVRFGRAPGVYENWDEFKQQVVNSRTSTYRIFLVQCEARKNLSDSVGIESKKSLGNKAGDSGGRKPELKPTEKSTAGVSGTSKQSSSGLTPALRKRKTQSLGVYTLKYDGASKGNPGRAGAGAVLLGPDGALVCRLKEGVGKTTNNVAEYRGLILGLREALERGVSEINAKGDSTLVCKQVTGKWRVNSLQLQQLCKEAKFLAGKFKTFSISYVPRALNAEADILANEGVNLPEKAFISVFETRKKSLQRAEGSSSTPIKKTAPSKSTLDLQGDAMPPSSINEAVYTLEFHGATTGKPPRAGAGAVLRHPEGTVVFELAESLGQATINAAEYHALILGLQEAVRRRISHLQTKGDSSLVCQQLLGDRKVSYHHVKFYNEAKTLIEQFANFSVKQIDRSSNEHAYALAKQATVLPGKVQGAETRRSVTPAKKEEVPSTSSDSAFTGLYGRVNANNQWNRMTSNPAFSTGQLEAACISCSRNLSYSRSTHALHCHLWNARCGGKAAVWLPKLGRLDRSWGAAAKCLTQLVVSSL